MGLCENRNYLFPSRPQSFFLLALDCSLAGATTFSITTLILTPFSITALILTPFTITTLSLTPFSIKTLSI